MSHFHRGQGIPLDASAAALELRQVVRHIFLPLAISSNHSARRRVVRKAVREPRARLDSLIQTNLLFATHSWRESRLNLYLAPPAPYDLCRRPPAGITGERRHYSASGRGVCVALSPGIRGVGSTSSVGGRFTPRRIPRTRARATAPGSVWRTSPHLFLASRAPSCASERSTQVVLAAEIDITISHAARLAYREIGRHRNSLTTRVSITERTLQVEQQHP